MEVIFFLLCFTLYLRAIFQVQAPPGRGGGGLEGQFNGCFFALPVWGAYIWRGLFSEFYGNLTRDIQNEHFFFRSPLAESGI